MIVNGKTLSYVKARKIISRAANNPCRIIGIALESYHDCEDFPNRQSARIHANSTFAFISVDSRLRALTFRLLLLCFTI